MSSPVVAEFFDMCSDSEDEEWATQTGVDQVMQTHVQSVMGNIAARRQNELQSRAEAAVRAAAERAKNGPLAEAGIAAFEAHLNGNLKRSENRWKPKGKAQADPAELEPTLQEKAKLALEAALARRAPMGVPTRPQANVRASVTASQSRTPEGSKDSVGESIQRIMAEARNRSAVSSGRHTSAPSQSSSVGQCAVQSQVMTEQHSAVSETEVDDRIKQALEAAKLRNSWTVQPEWTTPAPYPGAETWGMPSAPEAWNEETIYVAAEEQEQQVQNWEHDQDNMYFESYVNEKIMENERPSAPKKYGGC